MVPRSDKTTTTKRDPNKEQRNRNMDALLHRRFFIQCRSIYMLNTREGKSEVACCCCFLFGAAGKQVRWNVDGTLSHSEFSFSFSLSLFLCFPFFRPPFFLFSVSSRFRFLCVIPLFLSLGATFNTTTTTHTYIYIYSLR